MSTLTSQKGLGRMSAPPPRGSSEAYDEDEIVGLMTEVYHLMRKTSYLYPHENVHPPAADTDRHAFDTALSREVGMNDRVISLLERLPNIRQEGCHTLNLWVWSVPFNYFHVYPVRYSCEPHGTWGVHTDGKRRPRLGH